MALIDLGKRLSRNVWRLPVVGQVLARDYERSFVRRPPNRFRGVFGSFAAAEASIPPGERVGYDHDELGGMYRLRMTKANQSDYAVLYWLKGALDAHSFVFDFGGHVGVAYYAWREYLRYPPGLRWLVYDVAAIARAGEALARELPAPGLAFTSELTAGRDCSIFLAAGSLQYVDSSLTELLAQIGARPRRLLLNKLPVYDGESFCTVQSTGRAFHAYRIYNREELIAEAAALGYRLVDDWQNREQHCEIPFTRGRDIDAYSGFYFESA